MTGDDLRVKRNPQIRDVGVDSDAAPDADEVRQTLAKVKKMIAQQAAGPKN